MAIPAKWYQRSSIIANDSSIFKNGYIGGNAEGISLGRKWIRRSSHGKEPRGLVWGVPLWDGMLGGRELGATIDGGLGREGTEGDSLMCKDLKRNNIVETPTFTNLSLFAYTIRFKSKSKEPKEAQDIIHRCFQALL